MNKRIATWRINLINEKAEYLGGYSHPRSEDFENHLCGILGMDKRLIDGFKNGFDPDPEGDVLIPYVSEWSIVSNRADQCVSNGYPREYYRYSKHIVAIGEIIAVDTNAHTVTLLREEYHEEEYPTVALKDQFPTTFAEFLDDDSGTAEAHWDDIAAREAAGNTVPARTLVFDINVGVGIFLNGDEQINEASLKLGDVAEITYLDENDYPHFIRALRFNFAPIMDQPEEVFMVQDSGEKTISLTGISDDDLIVDQNIQITAKSSNTNIVPNPVITYTAGNTNASLAYTPAAGQTGVVQITVTLLDDGGTFDGGSDSNDVVFTVNVMGEAAPAIQTDVSDLTVPEGGTNTFNVRLTVQPAGTTTVTVSQVVGDSDIQTQGGSAFVFNSTIWSNWQRVTLQAASDADWVDGVATVQCSAVGLDDVYVVATEIDSDEDPAYTLPWTEPFEPTNITTGAIAGQHGWTGGGVVQTGTVQNGSQALSLTTNETVSHTFTGNSSNAWITFWAQPVRTIAPPSVPSGASAVFYVNTNDQLVAYSTTTPVTITTPTVSNGWNKFAASCDYSSKVWNLELNDELVVSNFAFYGSPASFGALEITEGSTNALFVDSIEIANSLDDSDGDGLPDDWETNCFGNLDANPADPATNSDYTVWQCYIAGLDPTSLTNRFLLSVLQAPPSVLGWNATSGRVYSIYWTSNLLNGFGMPWQTNITGGVYTDTTHTAEEKGFYKIDVDLE